MKTQEPSPPSSGDPITHVPRGLPPLPRPRPSPPLPLPLPAPNGLIQNKQKLKPSLEPICATWPHWGPTGAVLRPPSSLALPGAPWAPQPPRQVTVVAGTSGASLCAAGSPASPALVLQRKQRQVVPRAGVQVTKDKMTSLSYRPQESVSQAMATEPHSKRNTRGLWGHGRAAHWRGPAGLRGPPEAAAPGRTHLGVRWTAGGWTP